MRKDLATPKQIECLKNFGLEPNAKKKQASNVISYIINDNGSGVSPKQTRIALIKAFQKKWLGKKVVYIYGQKPAVVKEVTALSSFGLDGRLKLIHEMGGNSQPSPFTLLIRIEDGGGHRWVAPSTLRLIEE